MRRIIIILLLLLSVVYSNAQTIEVHCPTSLSPFLTLQHFKAWDKASVFAFVDVPLYCGDVYGEVALDLNIVRFGSMTMTAHTELNMLLAKNYDIAALAGVCFAHPNFSVMAMYRKQFDKNTYQVTATWTTSYDRAVHFTGYIDVWDRFANAQPQLWVRLFKGLFVGTEVDIFYMFGDKISVTPTIGVKYDF